MTLEAIGESTAPVGAPNDDRFLCDTTRGLFFVCDASGPTYGGYYAPFAIDPGVTSFLATFDGTRGTARERLVAAFTAAHSTMRAMNDEYERRRANRSGLAAAREAADAVRPSAWRKHDSLAHFGGSITACAIGADGVAVAQVGICRAYTLEAELKLVLRDGSIGSILDASGAEIEVDESLRSAPAVLLGMGEPRIDSVDVAPTSPLVLCTEGVWPASGAVRELEGARSNADVRRVLDRASAETHRAATAVVLRF